MPDAAQQRKSKGFTLIELLVVIAIIGFLSTLGMISLGNHRARARDAKRLYDMNVFRTALSLFFDKYGEYPRSCSTGPNGVPYINCASPLYPFDRDTSSGGVLYDYSADTAGFLPPYQFLPSLNEFLSGDNIMDPINKNSGPLTNYSYVYYFDRFGEICGNPGEAFVLATRLELWQNAPHGENVSEECGDTSRFGSPSTYGYVVRMRTP